jgi:molybdate transport system permease protein
MEQIWNSLRLSLLVASTATLFIAITGLAIACLLARCEFRGKELLDALLTVPMVLPPTVVGYYLIVLFGKKGILGQVLYQITGKSLVFTWEGAALAAFTVALPLMIKVSRAAIESVEPDLVKASYSLGKSERETLVRIILPLARNGIVAGILLSFARALGEFGATLMIAGNIPGKTSTMPLAIYSAFQSGESETANVLGLILTLVSVVVLILAQRWSRPRWM